MEFWTFLHGGIHVYTTCVDAPGVPGPHIDRRMDNMLGGAIQNGSNIPRNVSSVQFFLFDMSHRAEPSSRLIR